MRGLATSSDRKILLVIFDYNGTKEYHHTMNSTRETNQFLTWRFYLVLFIFSGIWSGGLYLLLSHHGVPPMLSYWISVISGILLGFVFRFIYIRNRYRLKNVKDSDTET